MESKDSQGKPVIITDAGIKKMNIEDSNNKKDAEEKNPNDFVTVQVGDSGVTNPINPAKDGKNEDILDIHIKPKHMVFKPGE